MSLFKFYHFGKRASVLASAWMLTSCAVDSRWGPPKTGLREPLAWQYEGLSQHSSPPTPIPQASPVAILNSAFPVIAEPVPPQIKPAPFSQAGERKVILQGRYAKAPAHAPNEVHRAVAAANRLQKYPYRRGGGHAVLNDTAFDCSGAVSYVLREAGLMNGQMPSSGFLNYGQEGPGDWITVWAKNGHVYMTIGGLRLDTGGSPRSNGPRWKTKTRSTSGFLPRHPRGL